MKKNILIILLCQVILLSSSIAKSQTNRVERYLMITPPEFESTLTYFANYKRNIGFEVNVVTTQTTGTTTSSIKKYIQNQYNNSSTKPSYVLLVGDVNHIPAYEGNNLGKVKNDPISDLGYSLLQGNDLLADVFLGRFSISNDLELQNIINKTIFMEMNMHRFQKKAKFLAGNSTDWNHLYMKSEFKRGFEYSIPRSFVPLGYVCQKLYQPTIMEAVKALGDNPLYFIYAGHGNVNAINKTSWDIVLKATNIVFPCVFAFACKTGNFAYPNYPCFGERLIRAKEAGAVACFGSSVNSETNSDVVLQKKIFGNAFKNGTANLSAIINAGMREFAGTTSILKKKRNRNLKAYNLLGDPSFNTKGIENKINTEKITNTMMVVDNMIYPAQFSIFQNPTTDDFSLAYTLNVKSSVQIDLYNMQEELVKSFLQVSQQEAGIYYYTFSLSHLLSGSYILIYKNGEKTISSKIIKY